MSKLVEIFESHEPPGDVREDRREYQRVAVRCLPVGSIGQAMCQNPATIGLYGQINNKLGNKTGTVRQSWLCQIRGRAKGFERPRAGGHRRDGAAGLRTQGPGHLWDVCCKAAWPCSPLPSLPTSSQKSVPKYISHIKTRGADF